jgi:uncharacterized membrane protein required for colicin V production
MYWLSILTVVLLVVFTVLGYRAGLIRRILEFLGLVAAVLLASLYGYLIADWLQEHAGLAENLAGPAGWIMIFAVMLLVTRLVAGVLSKAMRVSVLGWFDSWGGAVLGLAIGFVVCSVLLMVATRVPGEDNLADEVQAETVTRVVHGVAPAIYNFVARGEDADLKALWARAQEEAEEAQEKLKDAKD